MNLDKLRKLIEAYNPASSQRTAESVDAHHDLALLAHSYLLPAIEALELAQAALSESLATFESIEQTAQAQPSDSPLRMHDAVAGWDAPELCRRALGLEERLSGKVDEFATPTRAVLAKLEEALK